MHDWEGKFIYAPYIPIASFTNIDIQTTKAVMQEIFKKYKKTKLKIVHNNHVRIKMKQINPFYAVSAQNDLINLHGASGMVHKPIHVININNPNFVEETREIIDNNIGKGNQ